MNWVVVLTTFAVIYLLVDSGVRNNHQIKNLIALILVVATVWQIPNLITKHVDVAVNIFFAAIVGLLFAFVIGPYFEDYLRRKNVIDY